MPSQTLILFVHFQLTSHNWLRPPMRWLPKTLHPLFATTLSYCGPTSQTLCSPSCRWRERLPAVRLQSSVPEAAQSLCLLLVPVQVLGQQVVERPQCLLLEQQPLRLQQALGHWRLELAADTQLTLRRTASEHSNAESVRQCLSKC